MTLKTLLKNAGVPKIRGLENKINRHFWESYEPSMKANWYKINELEKLNTGLQNQHQSDLAAIAKLTDQLKAAEVKQNFTDSQLMNHKNEVNRLEQVKQILEYLVKIKGERVDQYDQFLAEYKAGVAQMKY